MSSPFTALEKAEMLEKAARGELTPEDCRRYIEATRASFLAAAAKAPAPKKAAAGKPTGNPDELPDFF
jgi:hypothetical protein